MDNIMNSIKTLYSDYDFSYLSNKYIDKNYWLKNIEEYFNKENIENLTDFNYSKCFTYYIDLSNSNLRIGTNKIYLEKIRLFSKANRLIVLTDDCLKSKVEVPSHSSSVSVYKLLFENSETDFPY